MAKPEEGRKTEEGRKPALEGVSVVNTRSLRQARELDLLLEERGARSLPYPCIDIAPAIDLGALDAALRRAAEGAYDWLAFTSANAVDAVEARLRALEVPAKILAGVRIATVGSATAAALAERLGVEAELYPDEHVAEALADRLLRSGARRVLVPQAERARETLAQVLTANGVEVDTVVVYRTVLGSGGADVPGLLRMGRVDAVVFASPSAVDNMATRLERESGDWNDLRKVCLASIGPVTSAAIERRGLEAQVLAGDHTIPSLVESLELYFLGRRKGERVA